MWSTNWTSKRTHTVVIVPICELCESLWINNCYWLKCIAIYICFQSNIYFVLSGSFLSFWFQMVQELWAFLTNRPRPVSLIILYYYIILYYIIVTVAFWPSVEMICPSESLGIGWLILPVQLYTFLSRFAEPVYIRGQLTSKFQWVNI